MWPYIAGFFVVFSMFAVSRFYRASRNAIEVDWGRPGLNLIDGALRLFLYRYHRLDANQYIDLPEHGPAIIVANHISGLDPPLLIGLSKRPLRFLIAREEYNRLPFLFKAAGCIPVDRETRPEKALREAYDALANGEVVVVFPHGGIHWPADKPRKVKGGAIRMAMKSGAPIFPIFITGIGLPGSTLRALLVRSHVKVEIGSPFYCTDTNGYDEYVKTLDQLLNSVKHTT
ncbi:MAG: 1-acyl-sn-glycerol-3-phosphate acyltransferase [Gammaproteobacteria bacterium]|nr:1-acyl-sn-glycerol-3-phosphate acyltransferase [Gammaproteobacteria bacterium]